MPGSASEWNTPTAGSACRARATRAGCRGRAGRGSFRAGPGPAWAGSLARLRDLVRCASFGARIPSCLKLPFRAFLHALSRAALRTRAWARQSFSSGVCAYAIRRSLTSVRARAHWQASQRGHVRARTFLARSKIIPTSSSPPPPPSPASFAAASAPASGPASPAAGCSAAGSSVGRIKSRSILRTRGRARKDQWRHIVARAGASLAASHAAQRARGECRPPAPPQLPAPRPRLLSRCSESHLLPTLLKLSFPSSALHHPAEAQSEGEENEDRGEENEDRRELPCLAALNFQRQAKGASQFSWMEAMGVLEMEIAPANGWVSDRNRLQFGTS